MTVLLAAQPEIWQRLSLAEDEQEFLETWLSCLVSLIGQVVQSTVIWGDAANVGPFRPRVTLPLGSGPDRSLAELCERVLELRVPLTQTAPRVLLVHPVMLEANLYGLVALQFENHIPAHADDVLRWGMGWLRERIVGSESHTADVLRERLFVMLDVLTHVIDASKAVTATQSVATELAQHLGCERVSLGFGKSNGIRLFALSHSADFSRRNDLTQAIEAAMNEAADQGETLFSQAGTRSADEGRLVLSREHDRLRRDFDTDAVLTVPFKAGEESGVFTFEWARAEDGEAWRDFAASLVPLMGRALLDRRQQDRPWPKRAHEFMLLEWRKLIGAHQGARKVFALVAVGLVLFLALAKGNFLVGAHSELEGGVRRVIAAPFDGFVASSVSRAGHVVKLGEVLATLDDRDLRLETVRWESQQTQFSKQANEAQAQHNLSQLQISLAQTRQAEAQRDLSEAMLDRSQIRAPFAGVIISGDLSQNLGGSVKKGQSLFEIAPLDSYRVILNVDESDIPHVKAGQQGELMLAALVGERFPFTVTLVTPVAQAKEGKNVFRVEATLDATTPRLRPGMEGVAKVNTGRASLVWIWTHRFFDWLRLQSWVWLGV
jgi:multidrug resistance efflux pump